MSGSYTNFGVQAVVDVYPYEGGQFTMSFANGFLRGVNTTKSIQGAGGFSLELSPGGPTGTTTPTWSQLITPLSLVVISLLRGPYIQIVMIGVATDIGESQQWGDSTLRATLVSGQDLTYFFTQTNFYNLAFLFGTSGGLDGVGMLDAADLGLVTGSPDQLGSKWYNDIMAGSEGILSTTMFNFGGNSFPFKNLFGTLFQPMDIDIVIPSGANFLADEGNWMGKFQAFFQWPWYEFFINTVVPGFYGETQAISTIASSSHSFKQVSAVVVARVTPFPKLLNKGTAASPKFAIDMTAWNALSTFSPDTANFFSTNVAFSSSEAKNFYLINPVSIIQTFGDSNANINPFTATQTLYKDQGSVNRYGYSPLTFETSWFYDYAGIQARANVGNAGAIQSLCNQLLSRAVGIVHPQILMASGSITMSLRPDIIVGTVFQYIPFKDGTRWDFYVEAVAHSFPFGSQPTTTLTLSRGLPHAVYQSSSVLLAIFTGQAFRQSGSYTADPSLPGLTSVTFSNAPNQPIGFSILQGGQQPGTP
jgi:hypothetical protein